jgi:hypothetical protein
MARPATIAAGRSRLALGADLRLIEATAGQLWLEGSARLRPGQSVELSGAWPGLDLSSPRRAWVVTWRVTRLTREGPYYRGCCRLEG